MDTRTAGRIGGQDRGPVAVEAQARRGSQEPGEGECRATRQEGRPLVKVAAAYLRKSNDDERSAEDGKSIERQREGCAAYAAKLGWRLDPDLIFSDESISG